MFNKSENSHKKSKLLKNIFVILTFTIVISTFTISTVLYFNFERITLGIVYSDILNSLKQTSNNTNIMAQTGITLVNQISRDLTIAKLLYYNKLDIYELQPAITQLRSYSQVMQFINSVYIYNSQINVVYVASKEGRNNIQSKEDFDDPDALSLVNNYRDYKPFYPIPRKAFIGSNEKKEVNCYTFLGYNWLDGGDELRSAVIVNISEEWLHNVVNSGEKNGGESEDTFILDSNGRVISNSDSFPMMSDFSEIPHIRSILETNTDGYIIRDINGVKALIAYTHPDSLDWRYVRIIPYSLITSDINRMKSKTVTFSLCVLVFGLLFSVIASQILYKPIKKMSVNLDLLEEEMRNSYDILKQDFLRKIILENIEWNLEDILDKLQKYGIILGESGSFYLVILKIDCFSVFLNTHSPNERSVLKFAMMNIASEICSRRFKTESVDMNDDSMILLLHNCDPEAVNEEPVFHELFTAVQVEIRKNLELSVSVTISPEEKSIGNVKSLYGQTAEASLHRLFYGHGCIIFAQRIMAYERREYLFPSKKEKDMVEALLKGNLQETRELYTEIIEEAAGYPFIVANIAISRLVLTINTTLNTLKNNYYINFPSGSLLFFDMTRMETIAEIYRRFFNTIDYAFQCIVEKKNSKHDTVIRKINNMIDNNYMDPTLSTDGIADSLTMSSAYIGRLYKQYMLETILDRIIEVRMEKARALLLETGYSIARIAEMTGFSDDSYFYKTFKKVNGITPADYRKNNIKK